MIDASFTPPVPPMQPPPPSPRGMSPGLMVLAVLGIVFGILGLCCTVLSGIFMAFATAVEGPLGEMLRSSMVPDHATWLTAWSVALLLLELVLSILLLVAGVLLMRRHRRARTTWIVWAVPRIIVGAAGGLMQGVIMVMQGSSPSATGMPTGGVLYAMAIGAGLLTVLWNLWLPVFALIWLRRPAVRAEMSAWAPSGRGVAHGAPMETHER